MSKYKIRVNSLKLGSVPTNILSTAGMDKTAADNAYKLLKEIHPIGRIVNHHDIFEIVKFLSARNKSGWLTGTNIDLNGGWHLHGSGSTGIWSRL